MRRRMLSATALLSVVSLLSGHIFSARAEEPTFAELQAMCRNAKDPSQQGYCTGFVEAIALRLVRDDKGCALLQEYIDQANADIALPDLIGDLNPAEFSQQALEAVAKFCYSRGCT